MRDKPCHKEAIVSLQMATATYTAAVCKFGGGGKKVFGDWVKYLGEILGEVLGAILGCILG